MRAPPPKEPPEAYLADAEQRIREAALAALRHVRQELRLANLLCKQAQRSTDERLRNQAIAHARKIGKLIESALDTLHFTEEQRAALERELAAVALRIEAAGKDDAASAAR